MRTAVVAASTHRREEYAVDFEGHRAVQLINEAGRMRGEMIWRLATGRTVEVTEFGIFDPNELGRSFWESQGFRLASVLHGFYHYCDAALHIRNVETAP